MAEYDSEAETKKHIKTVERLIQTFCWEMLFRAEVHDQTKLGDEEKPYFDKYTPMLEELEYGSEEYSEAMEGLRPALEHHYNNNSHHPQHYDDGVNGMDLFDVVEMFMDWRAATERHGDGDINESIEINEERFDLDPQLVDIFENTVDRFEDKFKDAVNAVN